MASYGDLQFATSQNQRTIRGLAWPVKITNTGGMFSCSYNKEAVKSALIQLLLTQRGERPMAPDFGTTLRSSVFDPLDATTVTSLRQTILTAIEKYEPRVRILNFLIEPKADNSEIDISLVFSLKTDVLITESIHMTVSPNNIVMN